MSLDFTKIKALTFDVDGVFTDGGILCDLKGELYRTFDAKDGFAMRMAAMKGFYLGVITGGRSQSIRARFHTCGVKDEDIYLGARNKIEDMLDFCRRHKLNLDQVLYMGDDIPDYEVMQKVAIGACPCDASPEVLHIADYISPKPGGKGCVRDVVEQVLKAQNLWCFDAIEYKHKF